MTDKEAIKEIEKLDDWLDKQPSLLEDWCKTSDALYRAIQALEQQPMRDATEEERKSVKDYIESISKPTGVQFEAQHCEDCISRTELLAKIDEERKHLLELKMDGAEHIIVHHARRIIEDMPSEKPKYTDEEIDKIQAVEQAYVDKMVELAVEESKRPKGKWIEIQSGDKDFPESIVCSRCKNENSHLDFNEHSEPIGKVFVTSKYCPNCGAYMGGADE